MVVIIATLCGAVGEAYAQMTAHFISVGQAEAILLEFRRHAVLIDAGGENTGDTHDLDHLLDYLDTFFARRVDLNDTLHSVIISHPHLDHTRHLMGILENYTVRNLVDGGGMTGSGIQQVFAARRYARTHGIVYNKVTDRRIGPAGYTTRMLREIKDSSSDASLHFLGGFRGCDDENNDSLVLLVRYREASFLFTGDAEADDARCTGQINHLLEQYEASGLLDVDVYKVGHHGSRNGTTAAFLEAMTPEIAVISAGHHSRRTPGQFHAWQFGHPREQAVGLIEAATSGRRATPATVYTMNGVRDIRENRLMEQALYCTCWDGDVVIKADAAGTGFSVERSN